MSYKRRLSDNLIEAYHRACEANNEVLADVLREAAHIELAGTGRTGLIDRRPNSSAFRRALNLNAAAFPA